RRCAFTASAAARSFARWTSTPTCCAAWTPGVTAKSSRPGGAPAARPRRSRPSTPTRRFRSDAPPTSQRWAAVREPHHAGAGDRPEALAGLRARSGRAVQAFVLAKARESNACFRAEELRAAVEAVAPGAPGSPDRVLPDLRQRRFIHYRGGKHRAGPVR